MFYEKVVIQGNSKSVRELSEFYCNSGTFQISKFGECAHAWIFFCDPSLFDPSIFFAVITFLYFVSFQTFYFTKFSGIQNIIGAYHACIQSIQLYGPTNVAPIINHVTRFAQSVLAQHPPRTASVSKTISFCCLNKIILDFNSRGNLSLVTVS